MCFTSHRGAPLKPRSVLLSVPFTSLPCVSMDHDSPLSPHDRVPTALLLPQRELILLSRLTLVLWTGEFRLHLYPAEVCVESTATLDIKVS